MKARARRVVAALAGALGLAASPAALAAGATPAPKPFVWNRFEPRGLGISVLKPTTLALKPAPKRAGYQVFSGSEPATGTRFTLCVVVAERTAAELLADLPKLTGVPAASWIDALSLGRSMGFSFQRGLFTTTRANRTIAALLLAHATRSLSYVLLVEAASEVAVGRARDFDTAYKGLKALP